MNEIFTRKPILGKEPVPASACGNEVPYVPPPKQPRFHVRESGGVLLIAGGAVVVLLMLALSGLSHRQSGGGRSSPKNDTPMSPNANPPSEVSLTPILDIGPSVADGKPSSLATADQVLGTAKEQQHALRSSALASVAPMEDRSWQPPPYSVQSRSETLTMEDSVSKTDDGKSARSTAPDSLIFVSKPSAVPQQEQPSANGNRSFHLAPGTRLRARLQSEINSAVKAPVVAIIQENYEVEGAVVIPAGSRAIGRLENADKSGYLELHFDSLDLPFGSSLELSATATDLQLRPLRGRVQGKGTGRNLLVRSAAGIGEMAAAMVGRGSLNQPLSEEDMLRERVSNNIGQAGDQQLAAMAVSQRFVVSLAAGAEIYLIVEKASTQKMGQKDSQTGTIDQHSLDQLRQLLEMQRELSASSPPQ